MKLIPGKIILAFWIAGLAACTGGAGVSEGGSEGTTTGLSTPAGPVERPPVTVDSGPQVTCVEYVQNAENYEPEEVPPICKTAYENAPKAYIPPEVEIPQRVIPQIEGTPIITQPDDELDIRDLDPVGIFPRGLERGRQFDGLP